MANPSSLHSLCRWTFHEGVGRFVPSGVRPAWGPDRFGTPDFIHLIQDEIAPRLPDHVALGVEMHYDNEYNEDNAAAIAKQAYASGKTVREVAVELPLEGLDASGVEIWGKDHVGDGSPERCREIASETLEEAYDRMGLRRRHVPEAVRADGGGDGARSAGSA